MRGLPDPTLHDFCREHHVKVDLRPPGDLSRYFRDAVIESAQVQYAA